MTQPCASKVAWETLVDYFAGELGEAEQGALEEHLFGCSECASAAARVAQVTETLRALVPPVISPALLEELRQRGARVKDTLLRSGEVKSVVFPRGIDILLQRLSGLDLSQATRVSLVLREEHGGGLLQLFEDVPFDRTRGEVLVACQQHFATFPHDLTFELKARAVDGTEATAHYTVRHEFEMLSDK